MNCKFCLKPCRGPDMDYEQCLNCQDSKWNVKYADNGYICASDPFPDIRWIAISDEEFVIELDFDDQQTRFFSHSKRDAKHELIFYLNHLEKITPLNASDWKERILKLKLFY